MKRRCVDFKYSFKILVTYYEGFKFSNFKTRIFRSFDEYDDFCCKSDITLVTTFFAVVDYKNELVCGVGFSGDRPNYRDYVVRVFKKYNKDFDSIV